MMQFKGKWRWLFPIAMLWSLVSIRAQAQLATNLLVDPRALSMGNAITADPEGLASIHYNPAGLAKLKGRHFQVTLMNIILNNEATFSAPPGCNVFGLSCSENDPIFNGGETLAKSRTISPALYIPGYGIQRLPKLPAVAPFNGFSVNPPGSKLTFGQYTYGPEIVGYYRKDGDPARYLGKAMSLQRFTYLSPTIAYEINDEWKVGFTVALSHQALAMDTFLRAPNIMIGVLEELQSAFSCETGQEPLAPFLGICGGNVGPWDDIGGLSISTQETISPKYHLGALWEPNDWFSWGINYQSEAKMQLKGTYDLRYTDDWCGFWQSFSGSLIGAISGAIFSLPTGVCREAGNLSIDLRHPQHLQTGIKVRVLPDLSLSADVNWTDYSTWDKFLLEFDRNLEFLGAARLLSPNATPNTLAIPLDYKDTWNWGFGLEQHVNPRLDLRLGIEFRDSPILDHRRDVLAPLNSGILYGTGIGYKWDRKTQLDLHLSYFRSWESIPAGTSENLNDTGIQNISYNPYAGLDVTTRLRIVSFGFSFNREF